MVVQSITTPDAPSVILPSPIPAPRPEPRRGRALVQLAWWLPPILVLLAIWAAATGKLTETYYGDATGVAGELLDGHSVGQTFIAQHDGLSGVDLQLATYARLNSGEVVLHLRRDVTHTLDLATVRVPARDIANNAWHRFSFPPIANSKGQQYYAELAQPGGKTGDAITVYWALNHGDPYPYGRATADRAPLDGDLTFGLRYDPPPGALWTDLIGTLTTQVPASLLLVLAGAAGACPILLVLLGVGARRGWFVGQPRQLLLLGGLLGAFALAHGLVWMIAVPPWQGPDEFGHYAYSVLLASGYSGDDTGKEAQQTRARIEKSILAAMDARGFTRTVTWYDTPGGPATGFVGDALYGGSTMYNETRQPSLYYRLAAVPLRLYSSDPAGTPPDIGLYLVRFVSVSMSVLIVLLAWGCSLLVAPGPGFRLLWLTLPLTIALLPMRTFIDSMANNDVLAELGVTLLMLVLFEWLARPHPLDRRAIPSAVVGLGLVVLAGAAKTSTAALAAPFLWLGALIGAVGIEAYQARGRSGQRARYALVAVGGLLLLLAAGGLATSFETSTTAEGWALDSGQRAPHSAPGDAHAGTWVLDLPDSHPVSQRVDFTPRHPIYNVVFQVWARPVRGAAPGHLTASLSSAATPITATAGTLTWTAGAPLTWQPITATSTVSSTAPFVRIMLQTDTRAEVDDGTLRITEPAAGGAPVSLALRNPSMEESGVQVWPGSLVDLITSHLPEALQANLIVDTLANPQGFDKGALTGTYLDNEYRSYWGWFGWLVPPLQLPQAQYLLWGAIVVLVLIGWLSGWIVRPRMAPALLTLGLVMLLVLIVAAGLTVARQMMLFANFALRDFPQGRYLFVLVVPTAWLLLAGLGRLAALLSRRMPGTDEDRADPPLRWGSWLGLNLMVYLDLYALLALILPYYYGRF